MYYVRAGILQDIFKIMSKNEGVVSGSDIGIFLLGVSLALYVALQLYKHFQEQAKESSDDVDEVSSLYEIKSKISQVRSEIEKLKKVSDIEDQVGDIKEDIDKSDIEKVEEIYKLVRELHAWHDKEDKHGRKIWYVQFTMKELVSDVFEGVNDIMRLIEKLVEDVDEIQQKQMKQRDEDGS